MDRNTIDMKCKSCGGTLELDHGKNAVVCPYCGAEELLVESDERIRQQTLFKEWEREDSQNRQLEHERYKHSKSGKVALVFAVICAVLFAGSITQINSFSNLMRTLVFLLQAVLFLMSYLTRREIINLNDKIKLKVIKLPDLLLAAGAVLIIAVIAFSTLH